MTERGLNDEDPLPLRSMGSWGNLCNRMSAQVVLSKTKGGHLILRVVLYLGQYGAAGLKMRTNSFHITSQSLRGSRVRSKKPRNPHSLQKRSLSADTSPGEIYNGGWRAEDRLKWVNKLRTGERHRRKTSERQMKKDCDTDPWLQVWICAIMPASGHLSRPCNSSSLTEGWNELFSSFSPSEQRWFMDWFSVWML